MRSYIATIAALVAFTLPAGFALAQAPAKPAPKPSARQVMVGGCYGCHEAIKEFHAGSKHAGVHCANCHDGIGKHASDPSARPTTKTDPAPATRTSTSPSPP